MRRGLLLTLLAALALPVPALAGGPGMLVGATDNNVEATDLDVAKANMDLAKLAGLQSMRVTEVWFKGQTKPDAHNLRTLSNVAPARAGALTRLRLPQRLPRGTYRLTLTAHAHANAGAPGVAARSFSIR